MLQTKTGASRFGSKWFYWSRQGIKAIFYNVVIGLLLSLLTWAFALGMRLFVAILSTLFNLNVDLRRWQGTLLLFGFLLTLPILGKIGCILIPVLWQPVQLVGKDTQLNDWKQLASTQETEAQMPVALQETNSL